METRQGAVVLAYNLQRQQITFSEKAFAYKMKNEAMKRTGGRRKSSQSDYPLKGKKTVEIIGEEFGDSAKQVQRYLKLTDLVPELLEKLDNGELSFNPAVELSYLTIEEGVSIFSHCLNGKVAKAYETIAKEVLGNEE